MKDVHCLLETLLVHIETIVEDEVIKSRESFAAEGPFYCQRCGCCARDVVYVPSENPVSGQVTVNLEMRVANGHECIPAENAKNN